MRWIVRVSMIVLAIISCAGCEKTAASKIGNGTLKDGIYRHDYFGMTVKVPCNWYATQYELKKARAWAKVDMFFASKYPLGTAISGNTVLCCAAEDLKESPGISGKDYLSGIKNLMYNNQTPITLAKEISSQNIGGLSFDIRDGETTINGTHLKLKYYVSIVRGYALVFVSCTTTLEEQQEIDKFLEAVHFDRP